RRPPPPGDLSVTGNGDLPLATRRRVESIASDPLPLRRRLDRIYQLGLWLAIFFAIFHRLPPNKFLRFRRTFHQFRSGWLCYFCYSSRVSAVERSPSLDRSTSDPASGGLVPHIVGKSCSLTHL